MRFKVIDPQTGKYPDVAKIALTEEWAKKLIYCDIDGFYIDEYGGLALVDDCGAAAWCPEDRFVVEWEQGPNELLDRNLRLRAVIDELPERFVPLELVRIFNDHEVIIKNALLKKHGVEV